MKKGVHENFAKFTGKHLWFAKFSKTPFRTKQLRTTASAFSFSEAATRGVLRKKAVFENFTKFTGKQLWFAEFVRAAFLQNTSG